MTCATIAEKMRYTKKYLDNGLTILLDPMPQIESLTVRLLFKVGSLDEAERIQGISHIVEHMLFKGTKRRSAKGIAEELDMIGGYLNAYTAKEKTVYYIKVLKEDLKTALDLLADLVRFSVFDQQELEKEKMVIKQELTDDEDTPEDVLFNNLWSNAFPNHQIGKPIGGSHQSVSSCTREDILSFVADHYSPKNALISISGNFNEEELLLLMGEKFGGWSGPSKIKTSKEKPNYCGGDKRIAKPIEQVHLALSFKGVDLHDQNYYLFQVAALIAGGSMSSRLFQEIREKAGLAYSISAFSSSYSNCGLWSVYAAANPESVNQLIDLTIEELKKMTYSITEKELKAAKAQVKSSLLMSLESSSNRAEKLVSDFSTFSRLINHDEIVSEIDKISVEDLQNCLKTILSESSNCNFIAVGKIDTLQSYEEILSKFNGEIQINS